jgi:hypothetical protein
MSRERHLARKGWTARVFFSRRSLVLIAVSLLILVTANLSLVTFGGTDLANAAVQRAKSFIELIKQRSPGKRTEAHLALTKHKKVAQLHQRALPKVRMPPAIPPIGALPPALIDIVAPPPPLRVASLETIPVVPLFGTPVFPVVPSSPESPLIVPPQTPSETPTPPVTPPVPAVPEPGTWASILLGFALLGWQVRRRRAETTSAQSA